MTFNKRKLERLIKDNPNLTMQDIADILGVSRTTLYNYCNNLGIELRRKRNNKK